MRDPTIVHVLYRQLSLSELHSPSVFQCSPTNPWSPDTVYRNRTTIGHQRAILIGGSVYKCLDCNFTALQHDAPSPSLPPAFSALLAWFDPNHVTIENGAVISAPNFAPEAPGPFTQTTTAWQPGWRATAMNGTPGLVGTPAGDPMNPTGGLKHLNGAIRPVLTGTIATSSYTAIQALLCTAPHRWTPRGLLVKARASRPHPHSTAVCRVRCSHSWLSRMATFRT